MTKRSLDEIFNSTVQEFLVEKFGVERSGVEKSGVEMSFNHTATFTQSSGNCQAVIMLMSKFRKSSTQCWSLRIYKPHYDYQNFSPLANGTNLNRQKYAILLTHWQKKLVRNGTTVSLMGFVMGAVMLFSLITQPCVL